MGAFPVHVFVRSLSGVDGDAMVPGTVSNNSVNTITSAPTAPGKLRGITYQVTTDADAGAAMAGTLSLEYRMNTPQEIARGEDSWIAYTATSTSNGTFAAVNESSGSATTQLVQLRDVGPYQLRVKFVKSSGAGGVVYARALAY